MRRRNFLQLSLGALPACAEAAARLHWDSRVFNAMGTTMHIQLAHRDAGLVAQALQASLALVRRLESQFSLFLPDSAVSRLNRSGELLQPPPEMLEILRIAQRMSSLGNGRFDVTVQPLWRVFDAARQDGRLPTRAEVNAARKLVDWRALRISDSAIRLPRERAITLNGIAQGYAADKVKACCASLGVAHALIHTGEWAAIGSPQHPGDWTLGIADPRASQQLLARVAMQGRCVASSADDQCSFSPDFVHHHIFDPDTGYSPPDLSSVTVLADKCVHADALTKVFFVAGYARALPLARVLGVDVLVVDKQGRWQASPGVALQSL